MPLVLLLACAPAKDAADRASGDTAADTVDSGGGDTGGSDRADSGDSDTADTDTGGSDTSGSDTGEPDAGWMTANIVYGGASYTLSCDSTSGDGFTRIFSDALGNLPGLVSCGGEDAGTATISFVSGAAGSWANPDDGFNSPARPPPRRGRRRAHRTRARSARSQRQRRGPRTVRPRR